MISCTHRGFVEKRVYRRVRGVVAENATYEDLVYGDLRHYTGLDPSRLRGVSLLGLYFHTRYTKGIRKTSSYPSRDYVACWDENLPPLSSGVFLPA